MKFMSYYSAIILRTFLNRFFKIILFVFFLILSTVVYGGSWNVVWQDDFGVVEDSVCRDFADPNMSVPGHMVADVAHMADGYYGITNSTAWCFIHKKSINPIEDYNFVPGCDHTGNKNGGMLVVNVDGPGKGEHIYENNLKLKPCGSHKYRLSMFVANVSDALINPDLTLQVWNMKDAANPVVLESVHLSENDVVSWPGGEKYLQGITHKKRDWTEASVEFEAKTGDVLKIVILNNNPGGYGNDFALDDITLQRYDDEEIVSPVIEIENGMSNSSCVPTYTVNNIEALNSWKNIYNSVYFLWQYSTDDGYTWTNLSGESGIEKTYLQRDLPATGNEVYRLIITGGSDETEAQSKAEYLAEYGSPSDECDYFSISNIISQFELKDPPVAYLGIDNDITLTNQPEYDCENITHFVSLMADEWDVNFSNYYFLWQYSYDENTWTDLPFTGNDFQFTDDFDGLTYFRVILAAKEKTLAQVAKNGKPDDCDKDYFITNTVSIECLESCKKPEFEILSDKIKFICKNSGDLVEWNVRQTNQTKTTDIEWYSKPIGANSWTLIAGEKGESIKNLNPNDTTSYLLLAKNGKCVSDSIIFEVIVIPPFIIEPIGDIPLCEGTDIIFAPDVTTRTLSPITFFLDGVPTTDEYYKVVVTEDKSLSFYATDGVCTSNEVYANFILEKRAKVTLQSLPSVICEGEKVDLIADAQISSVNTFRWEKDNKLISDVDLVTSDFPSEDATYKFTVEGSLCPPFEKEFNVKVEKKADVTLQQPQPSVVCIGEEIDLIADAKLTSANTFKWEDGSGEFLGDVDLKISVIPADDDTYKFTVYGDKCPTIEKEVSVKVEKMAEVTLEPLPAVVCEGTDVDLVADAKLTSANTFKWEKGNDLLTDIGLKTTDNPTEDATYKFTITGDKCPTIEREVSVKVEKKAVVTLLQPQPSKVCIGEEIDLVADAKLTSANSFKWEDGNGELLSDVDINISVIPAEDDTYKFTVYGDKCPAIEKEVSVKVEKIAEVTLQPLPSIICEGEKVDLIADASLSSTNSFKWERGNELITDADLSTSDIPTEDVTYKFTITGDKCPAIEKEVSVKVEKKAEVTLNISDTEVCENSSVALSVNATNAPKLVWKQKIDGESQFSEMAESGDVVNITATKSATFIVESSDELVCQRAVSNEVSLFVEEPVSVSLTNVPTEVCEGTIVLLDASITENCTSYGWKKNENENFAKNELTAEDVPTEKTTYEFWAKPLVCPAFSEKFVVDVEHVKNVELVASESNICKGGDVTLTTNYPYVEGVVWESKGENESQFSKVDEGVSEIVVSPSDNTTYRVSAISKLGCGENGSEQEIEVTQPVGLSVEDVSICEGDAAHLEAVTERAYDRIEWKIEGDSSVNKVGSFVDLTPESTITYNVVAYSHNCPEEVNATITVAPIPRISSHEELGNHTYQMIVENTNETLYFDYHNGEGKTISNLLENAVVGKLYDVEVSDSLGCSSLYQFRVPFVEPEFPIYFYQGDENWQVKNIENYPNSTLYIYDRFGKLLFKETGNTDGWSGEYNGRRLPSTDYWYTLDIPEIDKQYDGHFTLMRR